MWIASFLFVVFNMGFYGLKKVHKKIFCLVIIFALVIGYNLKCVLNKFFLNKKETTLWQKFINSQREIVVTLPFHFQSLSDLAVWATMDLVSEMAVLIALQTCLVLLSSPQCLVGVMAASVGALVAVTQVAQLS